MAKPWTIRREGITSKYPFFGVNPELLRNHQAIVVARQKQRKEEIMTLKVLNILQILKTFLQAWPLAAWAT